MNEHFCTYFSFFPCKIFLLLNRYHMYIEFHLICFIRNSSWIFIDDNIFLECNQKIKGTDSHSQTIFPLDNFHFNTDRAHIKYIHQIIFGLVCVKVAKTYNFNIFTFFFFLFITWAVFLIFELSITSVVSYMRTPWRMKGSNRVNEKKIY